MQYKTYQFWTLAAVLMMTFSVNAKAMGLMEAYEAALANDSVYRAARHANQAGQEYKIIGRANLLPNVAASYSVNKNDSEVKTSSNGFQFDEDRDYNSRNAAIQLRQPILNLENWAKFRQGNLQTEISDYEFQEQKQALIQRLFGLYAQANYAEDVLALSIAERDAFKLQAEANAAMAKAGTGTKTALLEAQAKFNLAKAQVIESENSVMDGRNALERMIGRSAENLAGLRQDFTTASEAEGFETWKTIALDNNAELAAQRQAVALAYQEVKRNRAAHAPTLDAVASISKTESDTVATFNQEIDNKSIGLQLNIPIYAGGSVNALTRQAEANYQKTKDELESKTNEVLLDLRKQYNSVTSSVVKIEALEQSVAAAELLITATEKSQLGGIRTNLDVLDARKQLYEAKRGLSEARYSYLVAQINLKKTAGVLNVGDLEKVAENFIEQ